MLPTGLFLCRDPDFYVESPNPEQIEENFKQGILFFTSKEKFNLVMATHLCFAEFLFNLKRFEEAKTQLEQLKELARSIQSSQYVEKAQTLISKISQLSQKGLNEPQTAAK